MDKLITYDEMKAALEGCVAERGADFVYPEEWKSMLTGPCGDKELLCRYVNKDGTPSCIMGMAIMKNWPHIQLEEGRGASELLLDHAEPMAVDLASLCQNGQDDKLPWGEALAEAIKYTERNYEQD